MGAIEPARQAGSTDTKLDHQLDHDGFAVGILYPTENYQVKSQLNPVTCAFKKLTSYIFMKIV